METSEIKSDIQQDQVEQKFLKVADLEIDIIPTIYEIFRWWVVLFILIFCFFSFPNKNKLYIIYFFWFVTFLCLAWRKIHPKTETILKSAVKR